MMQRELNIPVVMRLRIALSDIKPAPWRRVEVTTATTLAGLHEVLQVAMGWVGGPAPAHLPHRVRHVPP